jgi:glycosyltransferase involved in cell wall biosynthesis
VTASRARRGREFSPISPTADRCAGLVDWISLAPLSTGRNLYVTPHDHDETRRRTRVLMLTKGLGRGGAERLIVGAARHLDRSQFELDVAYLLPWKDEFVDDVVATGAEVHCLVAPRPTSLGWIPRLRRLVRERDIDVVHTHMPLPAAFARLALPGQRPAFVHTEHNVWSSYRLPTQWANAATLGRNARVIAVSDGVATSIRSSVPVDVLLHGTDPALAVTGAAARTAARRRLGIAAEAQVVGTVGNLTAKKDQATLVRALASLPSTGDRGPTLVLVGLGPLEDELRALAAQHGVADRVVFAGSRDDVFALLPAFDVFALSSRFEGLPIALLEAMAAGVAPVATRVGGIPEVITDGRDGLLVDPGDPDALAAALGRLLDDAALRETLGERAGARAGDFDLVHAVRSAEAIYRRVAGLAMTG